MSEKTAKLVGGPLDGKTYAVETFFAKILVPSMGKPISAVEAMDESPLPRLALYALGWTDAEIDASADAPERRPYECLTYRRGSLSLDQTEAVYEYVDEAAA